MGLIMRNVLMLETRRCTPDGFNTKLCERGVEYTLPDTAACDFIAHGYAVELGTLEHQTIEDMGLDAYLESVRGVPSYMRVATAQKKQAPEIVSASDVIFDSFRPMNYPDLKRPTFARIREYCDPGASNHGGILKQIEEGEHAD